MRGWASTNSFAASCEATIRFGSTSAARMLPDTSMARMTVSRCEGRVTIAAGRAIAKSMTASPARRSRGGTCRRNPGPERMASFTMLRLAYRTAAFRLRLRR